MRSPLAHYLANDSVNNKQQYTATNGNITNIRLNAEEMQLLKCGLNYSTERPALSYAAKLNIRK